MCISYLRQKVTTWVGRDRSDHLGETQVITSYNLGQSYYLGRNNITRPPNFRKFLQISEEFCKKTFQSDATDLILWSQ